jgi:hypothetical protein
MASPRSCSLRQLCVIWSAFFAGIAISPKTNNISMIECFGVFSKVIALICMGSQYAAVHTLFPSHRRTGAGLALAWAKEVVEASTTEFAPPASRREIAKRWELALPPPQLECLVDHHPKRPFRFDSRLQAKSVDCGEPVSCELEEPPRCWNQVHNRAGIQTDPRTAPPHVEFVGTNRLFASLVFRQVRRRGSVTSAEQGIGSSPKQSADGVLVAAPDTRSELGSARPETTAQAASAPLADPIETLFSELARSRLRSLVPTKGSR